MSNKTFDITIYDFDDICRTCLSREDLKPLYEKCLPSTALAEMLITCTFVKFSADDGLPMKICTNCIYEINQSYSFAKRCETTDTILRKCVKIKTPEVEVKEEIQIDIHQIVDDVLMDVKKEFKEGIILSDNNQTVQEILQENEVKQEEDAKKKIKKDTVLPDIQETVQKMLQVSEIKQEEDMKIEFKEDIILPDIYSRKCVKLQTEFDNNSSQSQIAELIIKTEDERIEMKPETISPNMHQTVQEVLGDYLNIGDFKQEDVKMEEIILPNTHQVMEEVLKNYEEVKQDEEVKIEYVEVKQEDDVNLEYECDDPADKSYEKDDNEDQDETYFEKFDNSGSRRKHKISLDSHSKNVCSVCNKDFIQPSVLKAHMRTHTGKKLYTCEACRKIFANSSDLKRHIRVHTGEKPYSCKVCNKAFTQSSTLNEHKRYLDDYKSFEHVIIVPDPIRNYVIRVLVYAYVISQVHMRMHTGEKLHICEVCSKAFVKSRGLQIHMRIHTGEKPYSCKVCNKTFAQSGNLNEHKRIHTREKPYSCKVCNKAFAQSGNLNEHKRIHTREKPHTCEVCSKTFSKFSTFEVHRRIHARENPYLIL